MNISKAMNSADAQYSPIFLPFLISCFYMNNFITTQAIASDTRNLFSLLGYQPLLVPNANCPPITCRATPSHGGAQRVPQTETPVIPSNLSWVVFRKEANIPSVPGVLSGTTLPVQTCRLADWMLELTRCRKHKLR